MSAQDKQVGGNHYKRNKIQPWDIIDCYELDFYEGNALKYLLRHKLNRVEDLQKAMHYIEKKIELLQAERDKLAEVAHHVNNDISVTTYTD